MNHTIKINASILMVLVIILISGCDKKNSNGTTPVAKTFRKHSKKDMVLAAGGDFICAREFDKTVKEKGPDYSFVKAKEHFKNADLSFANLECVVSDTAKLRSKDPKKINYNAPSTVMPALKNSGFDIFSIANNHTFDLGKKGLSDFREHLKKAGLLFGGAGKNYKEASKPVVVQVNDLKVAFLFYNSTGSNFCADKKNPGYNCIRFWKKDEAIKRLNKNLRSIKDADLVFLSIHWGKNYRKEPTQEQIDFAHAAIDAGVDAILGHSSHIFQGIEVYKKKPILYDMGDVFLKKTDSWDTRSFFFNVNVENAEIKSLELFPIFMNDTQIRFAEGMISNDIMRRFYKHSKRFGTKIKRKSGNLIIEMDQEPKKTTLKKPELPSKVKTVKLKKM